VATFRAEPSADPEGRILRDNRYGSLEQDAWRRDFSINCLYYSIRDFSLADFTGGMDDLKTGTLRLVGDPEVRYREDPVRALRAVRFAAKLGFRIHPATEAPMSRLGVYLNDVPAARLYEEVLKLFHSGYAVQCYELMRHYGIFGHLFPATEVCLEQEDAGFPRTFVAKGLTNTDNRIAENKPVTPAFLFAVILWEPMLQQARRYQRQGLSESEAHQQAGAETLMRQTQRVALPRRFATVTQEIWTMQRQLCQRRGKQPLKIIQSPRFRAAYDFLVLRAETGEDVAEPADWWTAFQEADEAGRRLALAHLGHARRPRRSNSAHRKRR
jgi:poly(A) polymerase